MVQVMSLFPNNKNLQQQIESVIKINFAKFLDQNLKLVAQKQMMTERSQSQASKM